MIRYGYSWPGKRPGSRHWVTYGPLALGFELLAWWLLLPLLALFWLAVGMLWLAAECYLLAGTAIVLAWNGELREARLQPWLRYFLVLRRRPSPGA